MTQPHPPHRLRFLCWTALLLLFAFPLLAQQDLPWLRQMDIRNYVFQLELTDESDLIRGKANIEMRFLQDLQAINLDLYARQDNGKGMLVTAVSDQQGNALTFSQSGHTLSIVFPQAQPAKSIQTLHIEYEGIPEDGLIISTNKHGSRTFFGDNWPNRAHHWLPGIDHPSDKATVAFQVTAPQHYQVIGTGVLLEESNLPNDRKYYHWKTDRPLPLKVAVIGAAPFSVAYTGTVDHIPVSSWVFPEVRDIGFRQYFPARDILAFFHENLAPYPFEKLANVQSKTRYGGMENAGNIFYYEASAATDNDIEGLLAHEIAHQWFGNTASEKNWYHVWLSEGFATYFTHYYFEQTYGDARYREGLAEDRKRIIQYAKRNLKPIVNTEISDFNQVLNTNSYQKGSWVLHMLREKIGTAAFIQGVQTYYERFKFGNALTADLQAVMEEVSGQNLEPFFQQWVFQAGHPQLKISYQNNPSGFAEIVIEQVQEGNFEGTIEIAVHDATTKNTATVSIPLKDKKNVYPVMGINNISSLEPDPNTKLLFEVIEP